MASSSKEFSMEGSMTGYDDDELRGDGKKKKFKPLSAMRKFFTKKKGDKKETVVAVKAKSTTSLHYREGREGEDDEDDDGGFKSHQKLPVSLAATNRSLSEDSIFSPEVRSPVAPFPKSAISEESIPRARFQSELMSKLNKRRSQYSDDDQDDGLPKSPTLPASTTYNHGSHILPKHQGPSGKTSNRDSDQSLISVDASENEEEDLFSSKWKSSVPSRKSGQTVSTASSGEMGSLDLNLIMKTDLLVNRAAKDKILVKPRRKSVAPARQKKESISPPPTLPSLNEESPTRSQPEDVKGSWITTGSNTDKEPDNTNPSKEKGKSRAVSPPANLVAQTTHIQQGPSIRPNRPNKDTDNIDPSKDTSRPISPPASQTIQTAHVQPGPSISSDKKLELTQVNSKTSCKESPVTSPSSPTSRIQPAMEKVPVTAAPSLHEVSIPASPIEHLPTHTSSSTSPILSNYSQENVQATASSEISPTEIGSDNARHHEKEDSGILSTSERGDRILNTMSDLPVARLSQSQKEFSEPSRAADIKSRLSQFQMSANSSTKFSSSRSHGRETNLPKPADVDFPPVTLLEDHKVKLRSQSRSHPSLAEEPSSPKRDRSSSHLVQRLGSVSDEAHKQLPQTEILLSSSSSSSSGITTTSTNLQTKSSLPASAQTVKKQEHSKATSEVTTPSAGEPSWMSAVRRRNEEQENLAGNEKNKTNETASLRSAAVSTAPKSIFTSANYLEKKRSSIDAAASFKNTDCSDFVGKRADSSSDKRKSLNLDSQSKGSTMDDVPARREALEAASTEKETVEVEVSHLSSVRASKSIFDSSATSQKHTLFTKSSELPSAGEKQKLVHGINSSTVSSTHTVDTSVPDVKRDSDQKASEGTVSSTRTLKTTVSDNRVHDIASSSLSTAIEVKTSVSTGYSHLRSGSVKSYSPVKSEVKSTSYTRGGSIKTSSTPAAALSNSPTEHSAAWMHKSEEVTLRSEQSSTAASTTVKNSPPSSAQSAPLTTHVVSAPTNTSLPSTALVTSSSFVKPSVAYTTKTASTHALTSAFTFNQINVKPAATSTTAKSTTPSDSVAEISFTVSLPSASITSAQATLSAANATSAKTNANVTVNAVSSRMSSALTNVTPAKVIAADTNINSAHRITNNKNVNNVALSNASSSSSSSSSFLHSTNAAPSTSSSSLTSASLTSLSTITSTPVTSSPITSPLDASNSVRTSTSSVSSSARPGLVRPHSSFCTPAAYKPHVHASLTSSSSRPTNTSSLHSSPSFKAGSNNPKNTPSLEKATSKEPSEVKTVPSSSSKVPAWRTNLSNKEVKIEIIENPPPPAPSSVPSSTPLPAPSSSSQSNTEILRPGKGGKLQESSKKLEPPPLKVSLEPEKNRRTSKVLDLVKNFQNLQAPS